MNKVQDDIESIVRYFISAGQFIEHILASKQVKINYL